MTTRKRCELCGGGEARVHCESDQASLCWGCDGKVHSANFLVAKHVRVLLCGSCQAPTPWKASGASLGAAVTVCEGCFGDREGGVEVSCGEMRRGDIERNERDEDEGDEDDEDEDEEEEEEGDEELEEEEDGENQVVPWAFNSPPPVDSSSSSGEIGDEFDDMWESLTNRTHQITHIDSEEPECCGSCATTTGATTSSRLAKRRRRVDESMQSTMRNEEYLCKEEGSRMASRMVNLMKTLHDDVVSGEVATATTTVVNICGQSRLRSG